MAPRRDAMGASAGLAVVQGAAERLLGLLVMAGAAGLVPDPVGVPGLAERLLGLVVVLGGVGVPGLAERLLGLVVVLGAVGVLLGRVVMAGAGGLMPEPVEAPGTAERLPK
ncbi:hypothetical protein [Streptomyces sp. NRRL S-646]|uniref:hypothetical protein n=1 Tax=Streptomyces sp. NRRL S-646 TaxID=1463917 RepID=UPI0004C4EDB3|nr:hypothetical protein [Streptomyces sp. NRRL S-646]